MAKDYVEPRHESFYLIGSRVPLAAVVYEFKNGETPDAIRSHFPTLSLEQIYGAIASVSGRQARRWVSSKTGAFPGGPAATAGIVCQVAVMRIHQEVCFMSGPTSRRISSRQLP